MSVLLTIGIILEVGFLTLLERRIYYRYFTPFTILAYPFLIILLLVLIIGQPLGFTTIYYPVILYWMGGLLVFWSAGVGIRALLLLNGVYLPEPKQALVKRGLSPSFKKGAIRLSSISLLFIYASLIIGIAKFGVQNIGSTGFTTYYGSGLSGHLMVLNILLLIYFIGIVRTKDKGIIVLIVLIFISFGFYQVKTWIIVPILAGFYNRYVLGNIRMNLRSILLLTIIGIISFFVSYYFQIGFNFKFLWRHLTEYLFSGVLGFSEHLRHTAGYGNDVSFLFKPIVNIYNFLSGNPVENVIQKTQVDILRGTDSSFTNVKTFFGTILVNTNLLTLCLYVMFVSGFIYFFFIISFVTRNVWVISCYSFFVAGLFMGWFDYYFNHLSYYEVPLYTLIFLVLSRVKTTKIQV